MTRILGNVIFSKQPAPSTFSAAFSERNSNEILKSVSNRKKSKFCIKPKITLLLCLHSFVLLSIFIHLKNISSVAGSSALPSSKSEETLAKKTQGQASKETAELIKSTENAKIAETGTQMEAQTEKEIDGVRDKKRATEGKPKAKEKKTNTSGKTSIVAASEGGVNPMSKLTETAKKVAPAENTQTEDDAKKKQEKAETEKNDEKTNKEVPKKIKTEEQAAGDAAEVKETASTEEDKTNSFSSIFSSIGKKIQHFFSGSAFFDFSSFVPIENRSLRNQFSNKNKNNSNNDDNEEEADLYDYIVVGGGAAGCSIARTLADGKMKVLLIERGKERTKSNSPLAMDAYGIGRVISDSSLSQLVVTPEGVRTHIAIGMGGGSAISMGMVIDAPDDDFQLLEKHFPRMHLDRKLIEDSYAWVVNNTGSPAPPPDVYGEAYVRGLEQIGYKVYDSTDTESAQNNSTYKNSSAYNHNNTHIPQPSPSTQREYLWRTYSLFNATDNFTRNAADVLVGGGNGHVKKPDTLTIKTQTTVQRIEFNTSGSLPKAVCVTYRTTTPDDIASILSRKKSFFGEIADVLKFAYKPIKTLEDIWYKYYSKVAAQHGRACIKTNGQIILSAGAVLTPALLFKSGVGPLDQIRELGVPLIKEVPKLGSDFSDRVLIPIGVFAKEDLPPNGFTPNAGRIVGLKNFGPDCDHYQIGDVTMNCTPVVVESLSGARINEGMMIATRYSLPPEFRDDFIIDAAFSTLRYCADKTSNNRNEHTTGVCALAEPTIRCLRRTITSYYFTAEPKSRGQVKMGSDGQISVAANYMQSTQDLFDAVRGLSNIIDVINSDAYKGLIEPLSEWSCPSQIMNGFIDMFLHLGSQVTPYMLNEQENFKRILRHMTDLMPVESRKNRRLLINDEAVLANEENINKLNISKEVKNILLNKQNDEEERNENTTGNNDGKNSSFSFSDLFNLVYANSINKKNNNNNNNSLNADDIYNLVLGYINNTATNDGEKVTNHIPLSAENYTSLHEWLSNEIRKHLSHSTDNNQHSPSEKQWAAAYPMRLPDSSNPVEVAKHVLSYMTSTWHHASTAQIGSVVNEKLEIDGIENLSVVDASVLPYVPPMNPTSTIMMLARYYGLQKLKNKNVDATELLEL